MLGQKVGTRITMVRKMPNSGSMSTISPSVKTNCFFLFLLHSRTTYICCAATDSTGSSIRLNSSKQPQAPDWASPGERECVVLYFVYTFSSTFYQFYSNSQSLSYRD